MNKILTATICSIFLILCVIFAAAQTLPGKKVFSPNSVQIGIYNEASYDGAMPSTCTGTIIADNHILTAAQCVQWCVQMKCDMFLVYDLTNMSKNKTKKLKKPGLGVMLFPKADFFMESRTVKDKAAHDIGILRVNGIKPFEKVQFAAPPAGDEKVKEVFTITFVECDDDVECRMTPFEQEFTYDKSYYVAKKGLNFPAAATGAGVYNKDKKFIGVLSSERDGTLYIAPIDSSNGMFISSKTGLVMPTQTRTVRI